MRRKKEKLLTDYKHKQIYDKDLCIRLIQLKIEKLTKKYEKAKSRYEHRKHTNQNCDKALGQLLKFGCQRRILREIYNELHSSYHIIEKMVGIPIKANQIVFRINENSDYKRSCSGKVAYGEISAILAGDKMTKKLGEKMEHYKCRHCPKWHIGHSVNNYLEVE